LVHCYDRRDRNDSVRDAWRIYMILISTQHLTLLTISVIVRIEQKTRYHLTYLLSKAAKDQIFGGKDK
jgi:hypothetical protein